MQRSADLPTLQTALAIFAFKQAHANRKVIHFFFCQKKKTILVVQKDCVIKLIDGVLDPIDRSCKLGVIDANDCCLTAILLWVARYLSGQDQQNFKLAYFQPEQELQSIMNCFDWLQGYYEIICNTTTMEVAEKISATMNRECELPRGPAQQFEDCDCIIKEYMQSAHPLYQSNRYERIPTTIILNGCVCLSPLS